MGYEHLFAVHDLALLYDWLQATGELYMDLDRPHSGGSNNSIHFLRSLADLRAIIAGETWPEVSITIFREKQYPIRGIAGKGLLQAAIGHFPDRQYFTILSESVREVGSGDCHEDLRTELARLEGQPIWIGQDPFDLPQMAHPDDVFVVKFYRNPPRVVRNRSSYAAFESAPERYLPHCEPWV